MKYLKKILYIYISINKFIIYKNEIFKKKILYIYISINKFISIQ